MFLSLLAHGVPYLSPHRSWDVILILDAGYLVRSESILFEHIIRVLAKGSNSWGLWKMKQVSLMGKKNQEQFLYIIKLHVCYTDH